MVVWGWWLSPKLLCVPSAKAYSREKERRRDKLAAAVPPEVRALLTGLLAGAALQTAMSLLHHWTGKRLQMPEFALTALALLCMPERWSHEHNLLRAMPLTASGISRLYGRRIVFLCTGVLVGQVLAAWLFPAHVLPFVPADLVRLSMFAWLAVVTICAALVHPVLLVYVWGFAIVFPMTGLLARGIGSFSQPQLWLVVAGHAMLFCAAVRLLQWQSERNHAMRRSTTLGGWQ